MILTFSRRPTEQFSPIKVFEDLFDPGTPINFDENGGLIGAGELINDSLGACAVSTIKETVYASGGNSDWQRELSELTGLSWAPAVYQTNDRDYHWNDSNKYLLHSFGVTLRDKSHDNAKRDIFVSISYTLTYDMDCRGNKKLTGYASNYQTQTFDRGNFGGEYSNSRNFFERLWDAVRNIGGVSIGYSNMAGGNFSVGLGNKLAYSTTGTKVGPITINQVGDLMPGKPLTFEQMQKLLLPMQDSDMSEAAYWFKDAIVVDNSDETVIVNELLKDNDTAVIVMGIEETPSTVNVRESTVVRAKNGAQIPISEPVTAVRSVQRQFVSTTGSSGYYTEKGAFYIIEIPSTGEKVNISAREFSRLKQQGLVIDVTVQYR